MNKLFNKIAALSVGLAMAIGVGVAVGSQRNDVRSVKAETTTITLDFSSAGLTTFASGSVNQLLKYTYEKDTGSNNPTFTKASGEPQYSLKLYANNYLCIEIDSTGSSTYDSFNSIQVWATSKNGSTNGSGVYYKDSLSSDALYTHSLKTASFTAGNETALNSASKVYIKCGAGQYRMGKFVIKMNNASGTTPTLSTPAPVFNRSADTITWPAVANATSYELKLDSGSYATASSGYSVASVSLNDPHTVYVIAKASGYNDSSAGTLTFHRYATKGTSDNPFTVADARRAIDNNEFEEVYATGIVSAIPTPYDSGYGNITFNFIDEGGSDFLQAFRCAGTDAANVQVGDTVVVSGSLTKYGSTYEFAQGCTLVSLTHPVVETTYTVSFDSDGGTDPDDKEVGEGLTFIFPSAGTNSGYLFSGWTCDAGTTFFQAGETSPAVNDDVEYTAFWQTKGLQANPYTIAEAKTAVDNNKGLVDACVSGKISQVDSYNSTYHSITYWISDDGTTTSQLQAYSGKGLNSADFSAKEDVEVGADVVICGTLKKYGSTYEFDKNNYQLSYTAPAATPTISVSPATLQLTENGSTGTITASPENAGGASVVWTTSDATVATVSGGTVTPEGIGSATITAFIDLNSNGTLDSGEPSASCTVTISAEPASIDAEGTYTLVSDDLDLASGDVILITNADGTKALSTTQNENNRGCANTGIDNQEITISGSTTIQALLLGTSNGHFTFFTGEGYLYAASSSKNYLRTESTLDDNGEFTISIANDVATITAQGTNTHNLLQYNSSSSIFSCYGSSQQDVCIYKKGAAPVDPTKVTGVTLDSNSATIGAGETVTLTATVSPSTALDKSVSWSTSDPTVATVANGVVTGVGAGTATITVTTTDGNKTATCEVTVRTITLGFFYQVTDASTLAANDKVVIAAHVGDNIKVMENVSPDSKKMPAASVDSSAKWTDTFGNQTVKSFRHDAGSTLWTVSGDSTGWTFSNSSTQLYANASNTNLYTAASGSTLVLSSGTHGTFRLAISGSTRAVAYQVSGNVFGHYATSNIDGSAYYDVEIYKLVENPTVLTGLTCTGTGSYTGDWSSLTTAFGNLTLGEKAYYKHASYTVSGEGTETVVTATDGTNASVAAFVAKYDYIVAKYGTTSNPDFIGRNPSPLNSGRISIFGSDATNSGATLAIIIASILSLTAVGGYFVIRKRKFTK